MNVGLWEVACLLPRNIMTVKFYYVYSDMSFFIQRGLQPDKAA